MEEDPIDIKEFDRLPQFIAVEGPIGAGKTTLIVITTWRPPRRQQVHGRHGTKNERKEHPCL